MKKLYSFLLMLLVTMVAFAQSITVDRVSVSPGGTATVTVNISGASQFIAAGMYVELPKGFTFVYDDEEEAYTVGGDVFAKTHSITDNLQQENVLKFAIVSSKNAAFKKDSGTLFSFTVACGDNVGGGTHIGLLKTIEFSNTANQLVKTDNVTFSFAVNGGGTVDPDPVDPTPIDPTPVDPTPSDTTAVDPHANVQCISSADLAITAGSQATASINIKNATDYIAAGMIVSLPQGFTFVYDSEEQGYCKPGDVFAKTHTIADNLQNNTTLKFAVASSKNANFKNEIGSLVSYTITCDETVAAGTYKGTIKNIELSGTGSVLHKEGDLTFTITVAEKPKPDPTPQPAVQVISAADISVVAGGEATGVINITNATDYIAAGMFINLPQGFTFVFDEEEEAYCIPGTVFAKTHAIADNLQAANRLKFAVTSSKNAAFKTSEGSLLSFTILCGANVAAGTYTGTLSSVELSKVGSELVTQNDVSFTITVSGKVTPDPDPDPEPQPQPTVGSLSASGMSLVAGASTATGTINIKNASNYIAAGMFISLPEGFTFVYNDEQEGFCIPGDVLSASHGIVDNLQKANNLKFAVTSMRNAAFKNNEGTLVSYAITCDAGVAAGIYTGTIKKIELSELDDTLVTIEDITFPITVTANTNPEPTPVPDPVNVVSISSNLAVNAGSQTTATISIEDASKYIAAGMYISLPNGFSFVYNDDEECYCVPGTVFSKTHSIADNLQQDGLLKFAITSMKNAAFKDVANGSLVSFTIACDPMIAAGTYTGYISSIELSEVGSTLHKENDLAFTITVTKENGGDSPEKEYTPATVIAKSYTRVYGDENPDFGFLALGGDIDGTPEITCPAMATSAVGTYPIRIKQGSMKNKKVTFIEGTLAIVPAQLYISAGEYVMFENNRFPKMSAQYFGFKNNDNEDALAAKPTFATEAKIDSKPGIYSVEVSGAASQNYDINYVNGTITVYSIGDIDGDGKFSIDDVMQFIDLYLLNNTLPGK